jgi:hypothetical protein
VCIAAKFEVGVEDMHGRNPHFKLCTVWELLGIEAGYSENCGPPSIAAA